MSDRPDSLVIKPRRFRVSLWLLNDDLEPIEELDELTAAQCNYSLNQIPYAQVTPAHGVNIRTAEPSKIIAKLDDLIDKKAPVGILVERQPEPQFATVSTTNETDTDAEKWPEEKVFIFKGYIAGSGTTKSGTSISTTIQLSHWLQDLAVVSAYSPRAHTSTPTDFAADMCRAYIANPEDTLSGWNLANPELLLDTFNATRDALNVDGTPDSRKNTMFDCVIAMLIAVLMTALENMDECTLGKIDRKFFDKQNKALQRLRSCLMYKEEIRSALEDCWDSLVASLCNNSTAAWTNCTCWDKILGFTAQYYYAIAPTAAWAYIIPTPGCIPDTHIDLIQDELIHLYYKTPVAPILGGVAMSTETREKNTTYGTVEQYVPIMYPPQGTTIEELENSVGGPIATTKAPDYLNNIIVRHPPSEIVEIEIASVDKLTVRPKMEKARTEEVDAEKAQKILLYDLVKLEYLSQVFAGRYVSATTGFRGDIVPGACVHIHVTPVVKNNEAEKDIDLYGTVNYVELSISSQGQATTNFSLTNVRNQKEYTHNIYNPDVLPFYSEIFDGTKATIYCPFK